METIIVTGATGAMGGAAVRMLRDKGFNVIGTSRRADNGEWRELDLSSTKSISDFVSRLTAEGVRIDGLFNNAGTMLRHFETTPEGMERTLATNYLGTYLLTRSLLPLMNEGAHVVSTVSLTCYIAHLDKKFFECSEQDYKQLGRYANSKMAVMLFSEELHRRYGDKIHVHVSDPGVVNSKMLHLDRWFDPLADVVFRPFCKTPEQGATPAINALTFNGSNPLQLFRANRHQDIPHKWIMPELAQWLWDETEHRLGL